MSVPLLLLSLTTVLLVCASEADAAPWDAWQAGIPGGADAAPSTSIDHLTGPDSLSGRGQRSGPAGRVLPRGAPSSDLHWAELGPPARAAHTAVLDTKHRRLFVFGGRVTENFLGAEDRNDVWVLTLEPEPRWDRLTPLGMAPSPRSGCAGVFDPAGDRLVLFGGKDSSGLLNDVWELSLDGRPRWRELHPDGTPPNPRHRHTATFDPANGRVLVYAGWDGWYTDDLWQLDLSKLAWSRLQPVGPAPPRRCAHSAVLVPDQGGLIVFGGAGPVRCPDPWFSCAQNTTDVWFLSLSDPPVWRNLTPSILGPRPRGIQHHASVYDPEDQRLIVIGGYADYGIDCGFACFGGIDGAWSLSLRELRWSEIPSASDRPEARYFSSAIHDPDRRRILVYGGGGGTPYADTWALSLGPDPRWSKVAPMAGVPSYYRFQARHRLHYDAHQDRLVTVVGSRLWTYSFRGQREWSVAEIAGAPPVVWEGTEILDPPNDRLVLYGVNASQGSGETWQLTLDDPPTWSRLAADGDAPSHPGGNAIYDPIRERLILIGGYGHGWGQPSSASEVWSLSLAGAPRWSRLEVEGTWLARAGHSVLYDERRDRLVVFGGGWDDADSWGTLNDVWALPLSGRQEWEQLSPYLSSGAPPPRAFASSLYDPRGDRMIVVGGWVPGPFARGPFDDAWEFRFEDQEWRPITTNEALPLWQSPAGAYDSHRKRFLFHEYHWLWSLQTSDEGTATALRPTAHEPSIMSRGPGAGGAFSLAIASPNPFSDGFVAEVTLPETGPGRLELFDVQGRRVWDREIQFLSGGSQLVDATGLHDLSPGVYLLRLTQRSQSRVTRIVHAR